MRSSVQKAVVPVAGLGTRFLPATKTVPKELLPIVDRPILLYVIDEILASGIHDIVLVCGRGKSAIEDFFDTSYELEDKLEKSGRIETLHLLQKIKSNCNIISIRQKQALGLGHAVFSAQPVVGNEPFALLLGDEIQINSSQGESATQTLMLGYEEKKISTVGVMEVPLSEVHKYGIVQIENAQQRPFRITAVVEKPAAPNAPSRWALPGRYVFSANIFSWLRETKPGRNGEIQLTDAMTSLALHEGLYALPLVNQRFDAGDLFGYLQANVQLGVQHPEVGEKFRAFLKGFCRTL